MDNITLGDVLKKIRAFDWRGRPDGKGMGHVVLTREEAEHLHKSVMAIIVEHWPKETKEEVT
jgi:hypothetical protein